MSIFYIKTGTFLYNNRYVRPRKFTSSQLPGGEGGSIDKILDKTIGKWVGDPDNNKLGIYIYIYNIYRYIYSSISSTLGILFLEVNFRELL